MMYTEADALKDLSRAGYFPRELRADDVKALRLAALSFASAHAKAIEQGFFPGGDIKQIHEYEIRIWVESHALLKAARQLLVAIPVGRRPTQKLNAYSLAVALGVKGYDQRAEKLIEAWFELNTEPPVLQHRIQGTLETNAAAADAENAFSSISEE